MDRREVWLRIRFVIEEDPGTLPFVSFFLVPWVGFTIMESVPWFAPTAVYTPITLLIVYFRKRSMGTVFNWSGWEEWYEQHRGQDE